MPQPFKPKKNRTVIELEFNTNRDTKCLMMLLNVVNMNKTKNVSKNKHSQRPDGNASMNKENQKIIDFKTCFDFRRQTHNTLKLQGFQESLIFETYSIKLTHFIES